MATKRTRRGHHRIQAELSPIASRFFLDEEIAEDLPTWESFLLRGNLRNHVAGSSPKELWEIHGSELLEAFIETRPGKRPSYWWQHHAPAKRIEYALPPEEAGRKRKGIYFERRKLLESQAAFLRRLGLFLLGEESRLSAADFMPELIEPQRVDTYE
jgi:hypothetical protein